MNDPVRELVEQKAAATGQTLASLSKAIGRNHAYLQQFVKRGVPAVLPEKVRPKLAKLLRVQEAQLTGADGDETSGAFEATLPKEKPPAMTKVVGYVGAGDEAHWYAVSQGDLDEVTAPEWASENTVAVEVKGTSMGKVFNRWLVFYDDVRRPITPDMVGKLCVVGLENGQILVKEVQRSRSRNPNLYDLISQTEEPIRDAAVEWGARVKHMRAPGAA